MLHWYCVVRHPGSATPVTNHQERRHWLGLSRVLVEQNRSVVEVRAFRNREAAEQQFASASRRDRGLEGASLTEVRAWLPSSACLRSLKPSQRRVLARRPTD
ncbi:hypothetical protein GVN21_09405 [Caulobacter sp. SLTY]|uniref:hypothetical protein n=1 Tax=Caulobacter sp. SLTY TaxID=2683262 RepID=UPI001412B400|nr:hypothetical protein [Caulobacter sp. SLTY]NBB15570.1 hypothetical protein [Caulobacter sp. SLTY]